MTDDEERLLASFYDVMPVEALLQGGRHNGKRMLIPDGQNQVIMADPPRWPAIHVARAGPPLPAALAVTMYNWTGSILDDGTRVFCAEGMV